jgi:hypothetical protein
MWKHIRLFCFANGGFDALNCVSLTQPPKGRRVKKTSTVASMRSTAFRLLSHRKEGG